MTTPRHLWSGDWARESESAAEEMERRREGFQPGEPPVEEPPQEPDARAAPAAAHARRAAVVAFLRSLGAATARGFAAAVARLRSISPRQVGLVALATVAGAGVALGAAALAGGSGSGPSTSDAQRHGRSSLAGIADRLADGRTRARPCSSSTPAAPPSAPECSPAT